MRTLALFLWCVLLAAAVAVPLASGSSTWAEDVTRWTVRPALVYYAAAISLMLLSGPDDWAVATPRGRLARLCWTLAWAAYLIHVGVALVCFHHGSHAEAVEHTRQRSGVGEGIYVSHLFTLVWTADVVWWWCRRRGYAARPRWIDGALHGFMLFMVLNATVVFEEGLIRWAGVALAAQLPAVFWWRQTRRGAAA
jgi:hypothetical protein